MIVANTSREDNEEMMVYDCKFCFTQKIYDQTTLAWHTQDLDLILPVKAFQFGPSSCRENSQITPFSSTLCCSQSIKWRRR